MPSLKRISNSATWNGGAHFVFNNFDFHAVSNISVVRTFDRSNSSDVHTNGRVKLESLSPCCCFGISKHHADFFADLVDENSAGVAFGKCRSKLTKRLRHHSSLQTHELIADFSIEFAFGNECSNGVDDDDVNGVGAREHFGNVESFFTGALAVRLKARRR